MSSQSCYGYVNDLLAQVEDPAQNLLYPPFPASIPTAGPGVHVPVALPASTAIPTHDLITPVRHQPPPSTWWFEEYINDLDYSPTCDTDKIAEFDAYAKWLVIVTGTWEWDPRVGMYWDAEFNAMWPPISVEEWINRMESRPMPPKKPRKSRAGRRKGGTSSGK
ncbi:hypothetical protein CC1G_07240 [Coprinopsis cinerea okayama7|uniref:Uncharacterized protein n=1 Tax=Coprinopsis cinerea (strain Okayama-7 / 130 / ATCC MYA-4618 / FGSC 9003) TaxID=240176 RepID=A8PD21_COPC7|nr:hypothetical protein CC1G_07240 [Coprinopsis cinerea okayama7\|eukprot:XP_001840510.1 hypothetical protein CC1G_07240 [Coprinopsis cinerea okayama7\